MIGLIGCAFHDNLLSSLVILSWLRLSYSINHNNIKTRQTQVSGSSVINSLKNARSGSPSVAATRSMSKCSIADARAPDSPLYRCAHSSVLKLISGKIMNDRPREKS